MTFASGTSSFFSLCLLFSAASLQAQPHVDFSRMVVVGDSISAGVQNFSLLDTQQPNGYASLIATQAQSSLVLPLVPYPGAPNVLQLISTDPLTITPVAGSLPPIPRDNPCTQPTNLAVPGVTLSEALTMVPSAAPSTNPVQGWLNIVLGFPSPFGVAIGCPSVGPPVTMVQQAAALQPTIIIEWLGNNDALVPALTGAISELTPISSFAISYNQLLNDLQQTHAPIVTASVPDVTKAPYFTSIATIAAGAKQSTSAVAAKLGVGVSDLLRPSAVPLAEEILAGVEPGPLPAVCPVSIALPVPAVPCVLTSSDANLIRTTIDEYNATILLESLLHGAVLVDVHGLVDLLSVTGYKANGHVLTTAFLGGLFSLDGVHPTNTGYAIIANQFITTIDGRLGANVPIVNVDAIAAKDPLNPYSK